MTAECWQEQHYCSPVWSEQVYTRGHELLQVIETGAASVFDESKIARWGIIVIVIHLI